MGSKEGHS